MMVSTVVWSLTCALLPLLPTLQEKYVVTLIGFIGSSISRFSGLLFHSVLPIPIALCP